MSKQPVLTICVQCRHESEADIDRLEAGVHRCPSCGHQPESLEEAFAHSAEDPSAHGEETLPEVPIFPAAEAPRGRSMLIWPFAAACAIGLALGALPDDQARPLDSKTHVRTKASRVIEAGFNGVGTPAANGLPAETDVTVGEEGVVLAITAPRPQDVLIAFCHERGLDPVGLASGLVPNRDLWLGVFRDDANLGATFGIAIRRDRETGRWQAGDGEEALPVMVVNPEQVRTERPVEMYARR